MWKGLTLIVLGGIGAYVGGRVGLAKINESLVRTQEIDQSDIEQVYQYSLCGAVAFPLMALSLSQSLKLSSQRDLQRKGLQACEETGLSGEAAAAVAHALGKIVS